YAVRQGGKTPLPASSPPCQASSPLVEYLPPRRGSRAAAPRWQVPEDGKLSLTVFASKPLPSSKIWPSIASFSVLLSKRALRHGLRKRKSDGRQIDQAA